MNTNKKTKPSLDGRIFLEKLTGKLTLSRVIYATRVGEDMSQQDFADKLGISKQHLCDIEKGRKIVSAVRAWAWAKKLGYHPRQWAELALQEMIEKDGLKGVTVRLETAS